MSGLGRPTDAPLKNGALLGSRAHKFLSDSADHYPDHMLSLAAEAPARRPHTTTTFRERERDGSGGTSNLDQQRFLRPSNVRPAKALGPPVVRRWSSLLRSQRPIRLALIHFQTSKVPKTTSSGISPSSPPLKKLFV